MGASESKPEIKIILAGKTGVGKSSTGNTVLKKQIFPSESSPISKTKDCTIGNGMVYNRSITVIDTPGILSTSDDEENVKEQLIRALVDCAPGPFVVVFVLKVERYTSQEREIATKICEYFKDINFKQTLVLFTHGEQLEGQTIEEFVKKSPRLQEYVEKCEGRCHVIDNKYWKNSLWGYESNRFQVKNLLDTIDKMRKENNCHTNELLQMIAEEITREIDLTDPNLSQQERREKAKIKVFKKLLIRFAGVATGTLVGAIMGIAIPVATLVAIVKGVKNISATAEEAEFKTLCTLTEELDEATAGETRVTAAAVLGATAAAAVGTSASVSAVGAAAAAGATAASVSAVAAVDAIVAAGAAASASVGAAAAAGAAASASVGVAAAAGAAASASVGAAAAAGAAASASVGAAAAAGATASASVGAAAVGAASAGATAAVGAAAVEAGVAAGAAAAAGGAVAVEAGVAAGASIGVAAGSGIAVGAVFGAAALAGAIGGGITGYKAVDNADSVVDAIKIAAKANYENAKEVVKKAEELPTKVHKKLGRRI